MNLRFPWTWGRPDILDWTLALRQQVPLGLDVATARGQATLDLEALQVKVLHIETRTSSMRIRLPAHAGHTDVTIEAGSTSLFIHAPLNVAGRIRTTKAIASAEIDTARFPVVEPGREVRSPDYDSAVDRVDIQLELAFGSVEVA